jgi:imidazolonepropionase-like amidohydrolase
MKKMFRGLCLAAALAGQLVGTRDIRAQAGSVTLYEGARLIVGDGSPPIENSAFLVDQGRFIRIGRRGQIQAPAGATRVDLTGKTVIPALVNTHSHVGPGRGSDSYMQMEAARQAYIGDLHKWAYAGIAAVTSMGWDLEPALQVRAEYYPDAARLLSSERGAGVPLGQVPQTIADYQAGKATRMEEDLSDVTVWLWTERQAEMYVQQQAYKQVDFIKIWVDDRLGAELHLSPDIYGPLIAMAHQHNIPVFAHMFYLADAKDLARHGIDMLAHPIRDTYIDQEFIQLMLDHNVVQQDNMWLPWSYTITMEDGPSFWEDPLFLEMNGPRSAQAMADRAATGSGLVRTHEGQRFDVDGRALNAQIYDHITQNLKGEFQAGVRMALATDGGGGFEAHLAMQLWVDDLGMTPMQAITVATKSSAEALRLTDLGTVERGKTASFIVLNANPLDDIKNTRRIADVYLHGHRVDRARTKATYLPGGTAATAGGGGQ